jgi:hypothetical protein
LLQWRKPLINQLKTRFERLIFQTCILLRKNVLFINFFTIILRNCKLSMNENEHN